MAETLLPGAYQKRLFATLPAHERCIAESLLRAAPRRGYPLTGLPGLESPRSPALRLVAAPAAKAGRRS